MKLLTRLVLWIFGGRYVPEAWLIQARKERDEADLSWAIRYDSAVGFLQEQNRNFLSRALRAEALCTENGQSPQMIDIRVPRKVLR